MIATSGIKSGELLVIGYGNELRADDGAGPKIAQAIAKWNLPEVRTHTCHQLTPELAPLIAQASSVVFVDAAMGCTTVQVREIEGGRSGEVMTHVVDPRALLRLASTLYGRCPPALSLTVPAENFAFGESMSAACCAGIEEALKRMRGVIQSFQRHHQIRIGRDIAALRQAECPPQPT